MLNINVPQNILQRWVCPLGHALERACSLSAIKPFFCAKPRRFELLTNGTEKERLPKNSDVEPTALFFRYFTGCQEGIARSRLLCVHLPVKAQGLFQIPHALHAALEEALRGKHDDPYPHEHREGRTKERAQEIVESHTLVLEKKKHLMFRLLGLKLIIIWRGSKNTGDPKNLLVKGKMWSTKVFFVTRGHIWKL